MTSTDARAGSSTAQSPMPGTLDMKLEVVVSPVSDVERAKRFYQHLGWRLDADFPISDQLRVVQFTPTGSQASIQFGTGINQAGTAGRVPGPAPERRSYGSFAAFTDPDGNGYLLQEITQRLAGRV